uniref:Replication-associated protein n=1 Tax=Cressdnaviricota sp. TaxID=2748378 RepID=A0A6M9Z8Q7_9VIRU|nr:MAG: replication-associated protein [Cressdnaviricota sp.]
MAAPKIQVDVLKQRKEFAWTGNGPVEKLEELTKKLEFERPKNVSFVCWGWEKCPTTDRVHLQGYAEIEKRQTSGSIQREWGLGIAIFPSKGTADENRIYCSKDKEYKEFGEPRPDKKQGDRKDLVDVRKIVSGGGGICALFMLEKCPNMQQIRVAESYLKYMDSKRDWEMKVINYWGESGTGKSRKAREEFKDKKYYCKNTMDKWFDGYDGEEWMILDDFRDSWMSLTDFLSLTDRYERLLECKNGNRQIKAKIIIVTSIKPVSEWYAHATGEPKKQLLRRFTEITEIKVPEKDCTK